MEWNLNVYNFGTNLYMFFLIIIKGLKNMLFLLKVLRKWNTITQLFCGSLDHKSKVIFNKTVNSQVLKDMQTKTKIRTHLYKEQFHWSCLSGFVSDAAFETLLEMMNCWSWWTLLSHLCCFDEIFLANFWVL